MIRAYALVILDKQDKIIDRFNLPLVTNPTENGFKLSLSKISSDIEDIITKVVQQKTVKKFNVIQYQNSYEKSSILSNWIQKYSKTDFRMALEYNDTNLIKYCEGKVTSLDKTEKDEYGVLTQAMEFTPVTPYFLKQENALILKSSSVGKKYPYKYPYMYGTSTVENNEVDNPYLYDIPVIVTLTGPIEHPAVSLADENDESYAKVSFPNIDLAQGEKLVINSAQRKIYKIATNGTETDYVPEVDPQFDTFLRARSGVSKLIVNTPDAGIGFSLVGGWRQYVL
nr:MAG TPA: putative receptor binding protein [Caudoviricetes sp.]